MLTELSGHLAPNKFKDLSVRLEHTDTKSALAAEAELGVLWAIARVAHMVPEPALPGCTSRPEAASDDLFLSGPAIIEVRALSDDSFSGKEAMDRTANIIAGFADQLRKGAGKHLYFEFMERSYWTRRYHRERCVDPAFQLTDQIRGQLRTWITAADWPDSQKIRVTHGETDVVVSWKQFTSRLFRTFCSMPPVSYDREDNPIYKALRSKSKSGQLKGGEGTLRCVVLVDAGCSMLRRLRPGGVPGIHEVKGDTIIYHALAKLSIDVVVVLSPYRQGGLANPYDSVLVWKVNCFDRRDRVPGGEYERIEKMAAQLPKPRFEGYQARDIHRQGGFAPGENWYLSTKTTSWMDGRMTIRLSASLLHEYLAGRIDSDKFRHEAFNEEKNLFDMELARGNSIRQVQFESGGIDKDDDYVVFDLDVDLEKVVTKQTGGAIDQG